MQDVLCQDSVPLKLEVVSNSDEVYEFMSKCNEIHHITSSWEKVSSRYCKGFYLK